MYKYSCSLEATKDGGRSYELMEGISITSEYPLTYEAVKKLVVDGHLPVQYTSWRNLSYNEEII